METYYKVVFDLDFGNGTQSCNSMIRKYDLSINYPVGRFIDCQPGPAFLFDTLTSVRAYTPSALPDMYVWQVEAQDIVPLPKYILNPSSMIRAEEFWSDPEDFIMRNNYSSLYWPIPYGTILARRVKLVKRLSKVNGIYV